MIGASQPQTDGLTPPERQRFFAELLELEAEREVRGPSKQRRDRSRNSNLDTLAIAEMLHEEFTRLHERLAALEAKLDEVHTRTFQTATAKEYYTTQEVARLLGKKPYTVREWCRLGRIHGEKANFGRGMDNEWRVSHEELDRIRNEGLLCINDTSSVPAPRRIG